MAKVDTTALRRFVDPVTEADIARKEASAAMHDVYERPLKDRDRIIVRFNKANEAYMQAVGELLGGVKQLIADAETRDNPAEA